MSAVATHASAPPNRVVKAVPRTPLAYALPLATARPRPTNSAIRSRYSPRLPETDQGPMRRRRLITMPLYDAHKKRPGAELKASMTATAVLYAPGAHGVSLRSTTSAKIWYHPNSAIWKQTPSK